MANLVPIKDLTPAQVASICDHTFLNRSEAYKQLAKEGESPVELRKKAFGNFLEGTLADRNKIPYAVCVRPEDVRLAKQYLKDRCKLDCKIASVVGFPDGAYYNTTFKLAETKLALESGAEEIDMVLNYDWLRNDYFPRCVFEIASVVEKAHKKNALVKVILETSELNSEQIKKACQIANDAGADFVKTSTGFSAKGAKAEHLKIMRENFPRGIKMSGGVTAENYKDLLYATSGRDDWLIDLDPLKIRIGESSLLSKL